MQQLIALLLVGAIGMLIYHTIKLARELDNY